MDTCLVFCKALKVPYARSTTFLYFSLLSQDVQRACQRTDQFRPCFEQWAQIQFLCSSIYHFVCYVSAWSLTKVAIVLEGHFLFFLSFCFSRLQYCILESEYMTGTFHLVPTTIVAPLFKWGSLQVACKLLLWKGDEKEKTSWLHVTLNQQDTWQYLISLLVQHFTFF